jgi:hypothetical protein
MISPVVKFSSSWFAYTGLQVREAPYFYYDAYEPERELKFGLLQAFVGYTHRIGGASVMVKAGHLSSAFGSFPLRYDDAANPLLDQPLSYVTYLKLRPDQLPCGVNDLLEQAEYGRSVRFECGGAGRESDGMLPATLYGLPAIEADISLKRFDARVQLTNSSPVNPLSLRSPGQHAQWTAGGGYTLRNGLRAGFSAFRGPFLDPAVRDLLPAGKRLVSFAAGGFGADLQFARGHFSTSAEWQRFQLDYPGFRTSPAVSFGYVELKAILNPRMYLAGRAGYQRNGRVEDFGERSKSGFAPDRASYEFGGGFWVNRLQLLKVSYEWLKTDHVTGTRDNVFGVQFVTTITGLSKTWR